MAKNPFTTILDTLEQYRDSEKIALICGEEELSYRELIADARHIARGLMTEGVKKGDRVLFSMHRRADAIRALLGILYAGASYVAADPEWPMERLGFVERDARTVFSMTDESCRRLRGREPSSGELPDVRGEDEAAIYYTSGSTGQPKGAVLHHIVFGSVAVKPPSPPLPWERLYFILRLSFVSFPINLCLVLSQEKTFILSAEGEAISANLLAASLERYRVDAINVTPSLLLRYLEDPAFARSFSRLAYARIEGERLIASAARKITQAMNGSLILNYGSSEMFHCAACRYATNKDVHLGEAGYGVHLHLLDGKMEDVAPGEEGELFIGGIPAKYGHYLNRPELDAEKYVEHPPFGRLFRTGDLARRKKDGEITIIGRKDGMVKLHGQRIEIGEVESAMMGFPGIRRAAVRLAGASPHEMLAGYYTAAGEVPKGELRRHLAEGLPYYMVPSLFMQLDSMPENANGKLDYGALPPMELPKGEYVPPKTEREKLLCKLFAEALNRKESVSLNDNFFALGGDSISGLRLAARLAEEGIHMEMKWLFAAPSPALLAPLLTGAAEEPEELPPLPPWTEAQRKAVAETWGEGMVERLYPVSSNMEQRILAKDPWMMPTYWEMECDDSTAEKLKARFEEMTRVHESMRSVFLCPENERPVQAVLREQEPCFTYEDISGMAPADVETGTENKRKLAPQQKRYLSERIKEDFKRGTDLSRGPLLRLSFIRTGRNRAILYLLVSHLLCDWHSSSAFAKELFGAAPNPAHPAMDPCQENMEQHFRRLLFAPGEEAENYWRGIGISEGLAQVPKPQGAEASSTKSLAVVPGEPDHPLDAYCREHSLTLAAALHYCLGRALAKSLKRQSCSFLSITGGRSREEMKPYGMFAHTFPFVFHRDDTAKDCQQQLLLAEKHAWLWSLPDRAPFPLHESGAVFFDVLTTLPEIGHIDAGFLHMAEVIDSSGIRAFHEHIYYEQPICILSMPQANMPYSIHYDPMRADPEFIQELCKALSDELHMLVRERSDAYREESVDQKPFTTILDTLEQYQGSEKVALICGEEELAYRELIADAKHIARGLVAEGVKKGDRVLFSMHRRADAIRALLGILYAGASYVAADPEWPRERLNFVERDAKTVFSMTDESCRRLREREPSSAELPNVRGEDEAAIYYTSGSTGQPKGAVLHHIAFGSTVLGSQEESYATGEIFQAILKFAFVASMFDYTAVLSKGKTLLLSTDREQTSIDLLAASMAKHRADAILGTPSILLRFLENPSFAHAFAGLRYVNAIGEIIPASTAQRIFDNTQGELIVLYGTTEMFCCAKYRSRNNGKIHLGKAMHGVRLHLLDEKLEEVPPGEEGEIFIGGISAKYGHYLNRPNLDAKKYVEHPRFGRLFRTGDLARREEDGEIAIIGRKDGMVKLHGQRIEIGEVESAMMDFPGIRRAAVRLAGASPHEMLAGYYTAEGEVSEGELRRHLADRLPYYMVPSLFMPLDSMPENANGKLDYGALPPMEPPEGEYVPPKTEREKLLCKLFAEVLNLKKPVGRRQSVASCDAARTRPSMAVGSNDSFFALGGDSISGLRLAARLAEEGFRMEMKWLFAAPSPVLLAPLLTEAAEEPEELPPLPPWTEAQRKAIEEACNEGTVERIYPVSMLAEKRIREGDAWVVPLYMRMGCDDSTAETIRARFAEMTRVHEFLRSVFLCPKNERPIQVVLKEQEPSFSYVDLSGKDWEQFKGGRWELTSKQKHYFSELSLRDRKEQADLAKGPLTRLSLFRTGRDSAILYLHFSHILLDGQSMLLFAEEILGKREILPDKEMAERHFRKLLFASGDKAEAYWRNMGISEGLTQVPKPVVGGMEPEKRERRALAIGADDLSKELSAYCRKRSLTVAAALHYCLGKALATILQLETCSFLSITGGRNREEMRLEGGFVHAFPFVFHRQDTVADCQQQLLVAEKHAWLWNLPERAPFSLHESGTVLLDVLNIFPGASHGDERILHWVEALDSGGFRAFSEHSSHEQTREHPIFIMSVPHANTSYSVHYDPMRADPEFIQKLCKALSNELHMLVRERSESPLVFFFASPFPGHVNPMLPLMRSLREKGCRVRVYTGEDALEKVEAAGAECVPLDSLVGKVQLSDYVAYMFPAMINLAKRADEMIGRDIKELRPRCAIVDAESIWGRLLAEKHGLAVVLSSAAQVMNLFTIAEDWREFFKEIEPWDAEIEKGLASLAEIGFPKRTLLSLLCPGKDTDIIAYFSEFMQGQLHTFSREHIYFTGYTRYLKEGRKSKEKKRPLIYVTMGTFSSRSPVFFENCIEALRGMPADVVMAIWKYFPPERFHPLPENIRVFSEVDQEEILRQADLAIIHGGTNTVSDCLLLNVPMVAYPTDVDQFGNAKRVAELGAGIYIMDKRPETIRRAASAVLSNPLYRKKVSVLSEEMRRHKGADGAVDWLMKRLEGGK